MPDNQKIRFLAVEKLTFVYIIVTSIIIVFLHPRLNEIVGLLKFRLIIVAVILSLTYLNSKVNWLIIRFARYAFLGGLLSFWYPETFDINRILPNCDFLLANLEQKIFGFQPALVFCSVLPQTWFSELMNLGYLSYYPLIIGTCMYFYINDHKYFGYVFFSILFSFYAYYFLYIIFPTAGPQFYYSAIGVNNAGSGIFMDIGHYFNFNQSLLAQNNNGFFLKLVETTQLAGERPTAAFPSSHVGISTLIMILIFRNKKYWMFALILPLYLALVTATVYIQAHYLIDSIAGFLTAFMLFYLSKSVYKPHLKLSTS